MTARPEMSVNDVHDAHQSRIDQLTDRVADFSGSLPFLFLNFVFFLLWVLLNVEASQVFHDPYPFQFLTMFVSLEAIVLSILVLISQNRQSAKDRIAAEHDYQTNLAAKEEIEQLLAQHLVVLQHVVELKETQHVHPLRVRGGGSARSKKSDPASTHSLEEEEQNRVEARENDEKEDVL